MAVKRSNARSSLRIDDGLRAHGVLHLALREIHEDVTAFGSQFLGRPQPDLGARVRAGGAERLDRSRLPGKFTDQEEQIQKPHPGRGILTGVLGQTPRHVHGLRESPADLQEDGQNGGEQVVGRLRPDLAADELQLFAPEALGIRADQQAARLRVEQRENGTYGPLDEKLAVERLIPDLDFSHPSRPVLLAAELHSREARRPRNLDHERYQTAIATG